MSSPVTLICHTLWLLSALPGWVLFRIALFFPKQSQKRVLRRIIRQNKKTVALSGNQFFRLPLRNYEDILPDIGRMMNGETNILTSEIPFLLEPTGGSTTGTKLIPYTRSLKQEFQRAIDPWIVGLFLKWPGLLLGRHYWCITPSTREEQESVIPIGFDEDAAYLGRIQQFIARHTLAVPTECDHFNTLVHLLNTPGLRLISVWHPSLLTLMLKTLETRFDELLRTLENRSPRRAQQIRQMGCVPSRIWKHLTVISCWTGETCRPWIDQLKTAFPATTIQSKGLVATEGITSIPQGTTPDIAAVRSHYYEFECPETKAILPLWKIEQGKTYHLILTTGGGLYRYQTNDLIKVDGFLHRTPRIRFLTRNNMTSDLVGEKLSLAHCEQICRNLPCNHRFAMIAPEIYETQFRYALYVDTDSTESLESFFEEQLNQNYHYRHARNSSQLVKPVIRIVPDAEQKVINHLIGQGQQAGSIKLLALRQETDWESILTGNNR